jgi:hypothetical protein
VEVVVGSKCQTGSLTEPLTILFPYSLVGAMPYAGVDRELLRVQLGDADVWLHCGPNQAACD